MADGSLANGTGGGGGVEQQQFPLRVERVQLVEQRLPFQRILVFDLRSAMVELQLQLAVGVERIVVLHLRPTVE